LRSSGGAESGEAGSLATRVYAARVGLVYELTPRSLMASFAVSILCAVFFYRENPPLATPAWWLALSAVTALRYLRVRRFRALRPDPSEVRAWARRAVLGAGAAGVLWGAFIILLAPAWGSPAFPLAVFLAAGIPAVGLASNTPVFSVYVAFLLPILLPYAAKLAYFSGGELFQILGALAALIYTVALTAIARVASRTIAEAFELRLLNLDLVDDVSRVNAELHSEIGRRERAERVLLTAKEAAESANLAKSRFLAKMSHEIRTPMNGILGMTDLLKQSGLTAERRRYAEHVDEAARSLLQIIDDVLDVSRVEAGRLKLETKDFDLRAALSSSIRLLEDRAHQKGLELRWSATDRVPFAVHGDPGRLRQVLVNLVGNAVKFTSAGEVRVLVDLSDPSTPEGCRLCFEVLDTGIGIPAEAQAHLFEPFSQVDDSASRSFGGAGLGLAISRQLVELMGGAIGVESRSGEGARFWFTARFGFATSAVRQPEEADSPVPLLPLGGRVLLVEDNPVNREVALANLTSLGCRVDVAEDGAAAVSLAARESYDAILMDCEMPGLDGYDATRAIRAQEAGAASDGGGHVPIIALTASALPTDRARALESGMDEHLPKPFNREDLRRTLARWLAPPTEPAPAGEIPAGVG
jgi:signal transduction histidine kinase/ActR/RegA family two-component response regulator